MHNVYSVSWVNAYVKSMISQDFMLQSLYVKGEASNVKYHSSGHLYFTLKDNKGAMACVMFAGNRGGLKFRLEEGMQIVVQGSMDVYERDGRYQLYAKEITLAGVGLLYEKFERLKQELEERGMFDPMYKKELPGYIKRLGVVTAPTGAAVRDIISVTQRRNPGVQIILYPAIVQGDQAVSSIINGIRALEQIGVDVMIVGRGGGSIEDLWAFNEEAVAQAIFDCEIPVISAVGHETDTTIADFVADMRAPTPSAAAELAVFEIDRVEEQLSASANRLHTLMQMRLQSYKTRLMYYEASLKTLSPENKLREQRMRLMRLEEKLEGAVDARLEAARHRLALMAGRLDGLSPLKKLSSGYAFLRNAQGQSIKDIGEIATGDEVQLHVIGGYAKAKVTEVCKHE
ncbi:MAG: exodeoxyribonuclease VII large subunit [Lachnospiraceae bacterium]|nr:exodeoxyribonuclease VII large subunit [Lachnospiraceae bacterium]